MEKPLLTVLNRVEESAVEGVASRARRLGVSIDAVIPPEPGFPEALENGRPVPLKGHAAAVVAQVLGRLETAASRLGGPQVRRRL